MMNEKKCLLHASTWQNKSSMSSGLLNNKHHTVFSWMDYWTGLLGAVPLFEVTVFFFLVRKSIKVLLRDAKWLQRIWQPKDARLPQRDTKQPWGDAKKKKAAKRPQRDALFVVVLCLFQFGCLGCSHNLFVSVVCSSVFHVWIFCSASLTSPPHLSLTCVFLTWWFSSCLHPLWLFCPAAHSSRRLAYRMKMGTLPNPKSPKKPVCKFLLPRIPLHLQHYFIITVHYLQHLSPSALLSRLMHSVTVIIGQ